MNNKPEKNTSELSIGEKIRIHVIARKRAQKIAKRGVSPARLNLR